MPDGSKTLVLGLGNPILTDDGVGIHVVRTVAAQQPVGVDVREASVGGLRLLEVIQGCGRLILVDAIVTCGGRAGEVSVLRVDDVRLVRHAGSTHDLSFRGALEFGRQMGLDLPADDAITIVAVEAADVTAFGESCTPEVAVAIPRAAELVSELCGASRWNSPKY